MWLASVILVPLGIFLTYKAATDSALFDTDKYQRFFSKLFPKKDINPK
jgi:lipopolysaccharide export system permease protein